MSNNNTVFNNAEKIIQKRIDAKIVEALSLTANKLYVDAQSKRHYITGNLNDSIGYGIYRDGVLIQTQSIRYAKIPRTNIYGVAGISEDSDKEYWGYQELGEALQNYSATRHGWAMVFVSAMPYSEVQNEEYGYMELAENDSDKIFINALNSIKL